MKNHRVVVTGLGTVTPIGTGVEKYWESLKAGQNGIAKVTHFDTTGFRSQLAAEVKDFDPEEYVDKKNVRRMDRFTHFGIAASTMAMMDSGLASHPFDHNRAGIIIGSGIGGSLTIEKGYHALQEIGPKGLDPFFISRLLINMAACMVSVKYGLKGHLSAPSVACSTGANAIGDAFRIVQRGDADFMLAGAAEACVYPLAYGGFCATRSMTTNTDPQKACRPFDKNRDGFVMGEGAGIAVLENLRHALDRSANIYAEIAGYGNTADAFHFTSPAPEGEGMARVMNMALSDAGMKPNDVDYINAHGTSTVLNDKCESMAIIKTFDKHAKSLKISSNKSMIGHLMAASGAVEFVSTVMSVYENTIPPTINYEEPDPDCPLDYVIHGAEQFIVDAAMTNSFGFGGGNVSLIMKKCGE